MRVRMMSAEKTSGAARISMIIAIFVLMMAVQMFSAARVYAEELHYIRDNNIDFYLPDGWEVDEIPPEESAGSDFELLSSAAGDGVTFDLYYHQDEYDDYVYFDGDTSEAEEYYDAGGRDTLEDFYSEEYPNSSVTLGEESVFEGEWDTYIMVPVSVEGGETPGDQLVYFTARSSFNDSPDDGPVSTVDRILIFGNEEGGSMTAADIQDVAEPIVNGFYDFGYDDILMGDIDSDISDDYDYDYADDDTDGASTLIDGLMSALSTLIPIAVIVIVMIILFRRIRRNKRMSRGYGDARPDRRKKDEKKNESRAERYTAGKNDGDVTKVRADASDGYLRSLDTLRKSGLVTREEMRELLERYERNRREMERRKRRRS